MLAGGGSLGALQVGMLRELLRAGVRPDIVVGASVGALNAAFFASDPTTDGVERLAGIWRGLRRQDVFPMTVGGALRWLRPTEGLFESARLRALIERHLPYRNLEDARIPVHVVATNLGGEAVRLSSGPAADAILASAAIPIVFAPVRIGDDHLMDGAVSGNTPIRTAAELGATRLIVLPTGFACALPGPPPGVIAHGLHALTLLVAHQMIRDLDRLAGTVDVHTVPSLCPLTVSPLDFSQAEALIARAADATRQWLEQGGLTRQEVPEALRAHRH